MGLEPKVLRGEWGVGIEFAFNPRTSELSCVIPTGT